MMFCIVNECVQFFFREMPSTAEAALTARGKEKVMSFLSMLHNKRKTALTKRLDTAYEVVPPAVSDIVWDI